MRKRRGAVVSVLAGLGIGVGVLRAITPRDLDWIADVLDEVLDAVEIGIESGWNEEVAEAVEVATRLILGKVPGVSDDDAHGISAGLAMAAGVLATTIKVRTP